MQYILKKPAHGIHSKETSRDAEGHFPKPSVKGAACQETRVENVQACHMGEQLLKTTFATQNSSFQGQRQNKRRKIFIGWWICQNKDKVKGSGANVQHS